VPRDHPPPRRGLLDRQLDDLAFREAHSCIVSGVLT
jgi:hypothetical protein